MRRLLFWLLAVLALTQVASAQLLTTGAGRGFRPPAAAVTTPAFVAFGGTASSTGASFTIQPEYPTAVLNRIFLMNVFVSNPNGVAAPTIDHTSAPAGWALLDEESYTDATDGRQVVHKVLWKRSDGTESGTAGISGTLAGSTGNDCISIATCRGAYAIIVAYDGCVTSGDPFEGVSSNHSTNVANSFTGSTIVTTGSDRLGIYMGAQVGPGEFVGTPPAGWDEQVDDGTNAGVDGRHSVDEIAIPSATTQSAGERDLTGTTNNVHWSIISFALIPVGG
jgi:hypothetical protein